jgi:hypothetical protein
VDDKVYISSRHWLGILDPATNTVSAWGMAIPNQPVLAAVSGTGALTPGRYQVCYTKVSDGNIGGNGMIAEIDILTDDSTISLLNKPSDVIAWVTDPDGNTFYKAADVLSEIVDMNRMEPLPTFLCGPPRSVESGAR